MFTIKYRDVAKNGIGMSIEKLSIFAHFKGKTARRVSKIIRNIVEHSNLLTDKSEEMGFELGGKMVRAQGGVSWEFPKKENEKTFCQRREEMMSQPVEMNCAKIDFEADILPVEDQLKLTPLDYEILEPFMENIPED